MELIDGVHLVEGVGGANCYVIVDDKSGHAIVDPGFGSSAKAIIAYLAENGLDPGRLTRIVLTHQHPDHCGGAVELRERTGAQVVTHALEAETRDGRLYVRRGPFHPLGTALRRQPIPVDWTVVDDEVLPVRGGLRVVHTPGHTAGSICLFLVEERVLFAGDIIVGQPDRLSRPLIKRRGYEASLTRLAALPTRVALLGHGPAWFDDARGAIEALAERGLGGLAIWRATRHPLSLIRFARQMRGGHHADEELARRGQVYPRVPQEGAW